MSRPALSRRTEKEREALALMFRGWEALKKLGWHDAIYCPKDGTWFWAIEPGSTGVHRCQYEGEWPHGGWWIEDENSLWPSRPVLFKLMEQKS